MQGVSSKRRYKASHQAMGRAADHTCLCGKPAQQWAYQGSAPDECLDEKVGCLYSNDPTFYLPMCASCHKRLDMSKVTHCPQGHEYTEENTYLHRGKRSCKTCRADAIKVRNERDPEYMRAASRKYDQANREKRRVAARTRRANRKETS